MKNFWVIMIVLGLLLLCCLTHAKPSDSKLVKIEVKGLVCPFCAHGLEKRLKETGAKTVKIYVDKGLIQIAYPEKKSLDVNQLKQAVKKGGFTSGSIEIGIRGTLSQKEGRWIFETPVSEDFFFVKMDAISEEMLKKIKQGVPIRIWAKVEASVEEGHGEHPPILKILSYEIDQ